MKHSRWALWLRIFSPPAAPALEPLLLRPPRRGGEEGQPLAGAPREVAPPGEPRGIWGWSWASSRGHRTPDGNKCSPRGVPLCASLRPSAPLCAPLRPPGAKARLEGPAPGAPRSPTHPDCWGPRSRPHRVGRLPALFTGGSARRAGHPRTCRGSGGLGFPRALPGAAPRPRLFSGSAAPTALVRRSRWVPGASNRLLGAQENHGSGVQPPSLSSAHILPSRLHWGLRCLWSPPR